MEQPVYQIAAGEQGRRYADLLLNHDVMFLGPGNPGPYEARLYEECANYWNKGIKRTEVRRFAREASIGDIVLLREGYRVRSIGVIVGEYEYLDTFDDVYGWDLQHTRRVCWQRHLDERLDEIQSERQLFADRKQIPTFTRVHGEEILGPIRPLLSTIQEREPRALPDVPPVPMQLDEFCDKLFQQGLGFAALGVLRQTLEKQQRLLKWYGTSGVQNWPTEHEVVAHVILPLLVAIGWSEQNLAVEWHRVDLAVFSGTPRDRTRCRMICEAKGLGWGLSDDIEQAKGYCRSLELDNCKRLLVADGGRFYVFNRNSSDWPEQPTGYMNVLKLRTNHLRPRETSAVDTLMNLTPMQVGQ